MKKIIFVIGSLQAGGAERVASRLCSYWAESEFFTVKLVTGDSKNNDFYHLSPLVFRESLNFNYNNISIFNKILEQFYRYFKIRKFLRESECDTIILSTTEISIRFLFNLLFTKSKIIVCEHNNYFALKSGFKRFFRFLMYKRADKVFLLTERDKVVYISKRFSKQKIFVMRNPLGVENSIYKKKFINFKLLAIGRLTEQKAFHRLLEIFASLDSKYTLTILGEGPKKEALQALANEFAIADRVTFAGNSSNISDFYNEHDVLLMTSIYEGLPMVINEANAFGLPVIAYDCPTGPSEMIRNNVNGFLIPDGDKDAYVNMINHLLYDSDLYSKLSQESFIVSKKSSISVIADEWKKHLS
ncbi:glycosyltransferase family 4 protein [Shewanella xiamenensis]|uniref:glycosyltransferase family 4 protein n=1 Tax=Shewanella xiamenensis TaxID=332186 RepID=UPI00244AE09D|nr:glycosyltransferase family 4 protein [Shewanella xiamenensis]MDH1625470.1 glycosyltransferase family 4 protein [Shewanella xiamenensis]